MIKVFPDFVSMEIKNKMWKKEKYMYAAQDILIKECLYYTGPELVFVIYPQGLSTLPSPAMWSFLYFLMVFTLGLDSQVC